MKKNQSSLKKKIRKSTKRKYIKKKSIKKNISKSIKNRKQNIKNILLLYSIISNDYELNNDKIVSNKKLITKTPMPTIQTPMPTIQTPMPTIQQSNNIFNIFTTGILNWINNIYNNDDNQNLINIWNQSIRNSIISKIPSKFKINFYHYDPHQITQEIKNIINSNLILKDKNNYRVQNSTFINQGLNLDKVKNSNLHLVLDFASIFKYVKKINTVKIAGNYPGVIQDTNELNIKSLRTGFLGDELSQLLMLSDHIIKINENGNIETYVDMMIKNNINYDEIVPSDFIENIYNEIIKKIRLTFTIDIVDEKMNNINLKQKIINDILFQLENKVQENKIIKDLIEKYKNKFL